MNIKVTAFAVSEKSINRLNENLSWVLGADSLEDHHLASQGLPSDDKL